LIKFFKHIRQRTIKENRASKYFLYAIGEIVLVVIGILFALQINNWNSEKQLKHIEIKYLKEIAHNLKADSADIQFNIKFNEVRLRSTQMVLKNLIEQETYNDTMDTYYGSLIYTTRSIINSSAYETLKTRGLEIISNDSLRKTITHLYSFSYRNIIDFELQDDHALQYQIIIPEVFKKVTLDPEVIVGQGQSMGKPKDFAALKNDADFKNALVMNREMRDLMVNEYISLKNSVTKCAQQIRNELNNLEN